MKKLISCIAILLSMSANANIVAVSPSVMSATHTATQGDPRDYPAEISYIIYTAKTPQDFERLSDYGFTELQILDMQIELLEKTEYSVAQLAFLKGIRPQVEEKAIAAKREQEEDERNATLALAIGMAVMMAAFIFIFVFL